MSAVHGEKWRKARCILMNLHKMKTNFAVADKYCFSLQMLSSIMQGAETLCFSEAYCSTDLPILLFILIFE